MFVRSVVAVLLTAACLQAQTLAIRAGNLIDPSGGTVLQNQVILVRDGKIVSVGADVPVPEGAQVVDLSKSYVMPGLMDAHVHLTLGAPGELSLEAEYLKSSSALRTLKGLRNARDILMAGFTAVRDLGNDMDYVVTDIRRAVEQGWFPGPSILASGKIIGPFGGQSHELSPEVGRFWHYEYLDADTPNEVRKAVRQNIFYGVGVIKLVADNNPYTYSQEEMRAAVEEAHRAGLKVAVHVLSDAPTRDAILAGVDSIEHGFQLSDEVLQLMKQKGTVLVSTDIPVEHLRLMGTAGGIFPPPEETAASTLDRLKRAHRIGVKLAFGTDTVLEMPGRTRADMMLDYLGIWQTAGIPAAKTLRCMTKEVADLFGWTGRRGAIATGEAADIIAMPSNPLEDIQSLRRVHFVMKDGKIVRQ